MIVAMLYFQMIVPLVGLALGTAVLLRRDDRRHAAVPLHAPGAAIEHPPRQARGAVVPACALVALSLLATLWLWRDAASPPAFRSARCWPRCWRCRPTSRGSRSSSALTRWGILIGLLWVFGVELALSLIPGQVRKITLVHYARSILEIWPEDAMRLQRILMGEKPTESGFAVTVLVATTLVMVALTLFLVARKEFVSRTAST